MATLGKALISKIAGDNPAEKAFKPWWDNAQNFLVYGLVMLGTITFLPFLLLKRHFICESVWVLTVHCFYPLVSLSAGLIVAPTAIIKVTPLDCTRCTGVNCILQNGTNFGGDKINENPNFSARWVKQYCTHNNPHMNAYLMYFPYILLILALVLVLIERGFIRYYSYEHKLTQADMTHP